METMTTEPDTEHFRQYSALRAISMEHVPSSYSPDIDMAKCEAGVVWAEAVKAAFFQVCVAPREAFTAACSEQFPVIREKFRTLGAVGYLREKLTATSEPQEHSNFSQTNQHQTPDP